MFYHCATEAGQMLLLFRQLSLSDNSRWIRTLELGIGSHLFYHCAIAYGHKLIIFFRNFLQVSTVAGFKPLNLESLVKCSTTVRLRMASSFILFRQLSLSDNHGWVRTLELMIESHLFYHCACLWTLVDYFFTIFCRC
jgi:hypothetical protein